MKKIRQQLPSVCPKFPHRVKILLFCVASSAVTFLICLAYQQGFVHKNKNIVNTASIEKAHPIIQLLISAPKIPEEADIAWLNLACSPELTPASSTSTDTKAMQAHLNTLQSWATQITISIQKNYHHYTQNSSAYKNEAEWRLAMMRTVIGLDNRVRYDEKLSTENGQNSSDKEFFTASHSVFITGCLNEKRVGTCASLPVLYVALGRRMGYPMHLVAAKGHLFARWDDGKGTRINLEAANGVGFISHPDDYYRKWPHIITPEEERQKSYLKNLSSQEALAIFLVTRSATLLANGNREEGIIAASAAYRLAPKLGDIDKNLITALRDDLIKPNDTRRITRANVAAYDRINPHNYASHLYPNSHQYTQQIRDQQNQMHLQNPHVLPTGLSSGMPQIQPAKFPQHNIPQFPNQSIPPNYDPSY